MSRRDEERPTVENEPLPSARPKPATSLPVVREISLPALRTRRRRRGLAAVVVVALVAGGFAFWWSFVRMPSLVGFAAGNGRIEATEIDVATKLPGRVVAVLVEEGDAIPAGTVVARIDSESLEAQLEEARAAFLQSTEAHRAAGAGLYRQQSVGRLAEKEFERARRLFDSDVLSEEALDRRRMQLETADASIEQAMRNLKAAERAIEVAAARVARLRIEIEEATLVAPRAGRVLHRLAEPGEILPIGGKVVTLVEEGDVYMTVFLSEREAAQTRIGAEAQVRLDGFPDAVWPAAVSYVAPKAQFTPKQVETRSEREKLVFKVKVRLPNPVDPVVKPGMRGVAYIRIDPNADWPDPPR